MKVSIQASATFPEPNTLSCRKLIMKIREQCTENQKTEILITALQVTSLMTVATYFNLLGLELSDLENEGVSSSLVVKGDKKKKLI